MAKSGLFGKIANEILEATERVAARIEEGISVLSSGKLPGAINEESPVDSDSDTIMAQDEGLHMDDFMDGSPLEGIADSVIGDIMGGQAGPQTPMEHFHAFRSAIHWTEPFILSLVVFQVTLFFLCLWASRPSRSLGTRIAIMLFMGIVVRSSEWLNVYGGQHWDEFCTQNYFDSKGVFIGIFLSAPLLLDSFLMMVIFMREASQLLVQVKTMEIEREQKKKKKDGKKDRVSKKRD